MLTLRFPAQWIQTLTQCPRGKLSLNHLTHCGLWGSVTPLWAKVPRTHPRSGRGPAQECHAGERS